MGLTTPSDVHDSDDDDSVDDNVTLASLAKMPENSMTEVTNETPPKKRKENGHNEGECSSKIRLCLFFVYALQQSNWCAPSLPPAMSFTSKTCDSIGTVGTPFDSSMAASNCTLFEMIL